MSIAGSEEERPGDGVEGVRYFDFSGRAAPRSHDAETDPFALEGLPESHETAPSRRPRRSDDDRRGSRELDDALAPVDPFEFALVGVPLDGSAQRLGSKHSAYEATPADAAQPEEPEPPVHFFELASLFSPPDTDAASRERFALTFDTARAKSNEPFLAIALRMVAHSSAAVQFPIVADGIRAALNPGDVLLADEQGLRLAAVLHGRQAADARNVFAHLANHLRTWIDDADAVLSALSVLSAPDGRPFKNADTFLARAFDRD